MNNEQGSVEWFIEQLEEKGDAWENVSIRRLNISIDVSDYMELKKQAKSMHKEEIIESYASGSNDRLKNKINTEYYNETFGGNK